MKGEPEDMGAVGRQLPPDPAVPPGPLPSDGCSGATLPHAGRRDALPRTFGDYDLLEVLGGGGMGIVYRAWQKSLSRMVALKMLLVPSGKHKTQLRQEAQRAAALEHIGIVPIHEVGEIDGQFYYTMKLLRQGSLRDELPHFVGKYRVVATLVEGLARAVHHAHQHGILHRDIKPSNVLFDDECRPHIGDFGIAVRLGDEESAETRALIVGTPRYMAPEQISAAFGPLSPATDVYGLGVVLYEMIVGTPPFEADPPSEGFQQILEEEAPPLSRWDRRVPRDLETICMACLEKRPEKRYATALELAEDLRRFLDSVPIHKLPPGLSRRAAKWARRHPVATSILSVCLAALVALQGLSLWYNAHLRREYAVREVLWQQHLYAARMSLANEARNNHRYGTAMELLEQLRPTEGQEDLRGFEWFWLHRLLHRNTTLFYGLTAEPWSRYPRTAAFSPEGGSLATAHSDGRVRLWDPATLSLLRELEGTSGSMHGLAYFDGGKRLAATDSGRILMWDTTTGKLLWEYPEEAGSPVRDIAVSPDGTSVAVARPRVPLLVLDATTGSIRKTIDSHCSRVAYSGNGEWLFTARCDDPTEGTVRVWSTETGAAIRSLEGHRDAVYCIAVSPSGESIATASRDRTVRLWNPATGIEAFAPLQHDDEVLSVTFSPDGATLVTGTLGGEVLLWDPRAGSILGSFEGHRDGVSHVNFSRDGRRLISSGLDGSAKVWDPAMLPEPLYSTAFSHIVWEVGISPDGRTVLAASNDFSVKVWQLSETRGLEEMDSFVLEGSSPYVSGSLARDGSLGIAATSDHHLDIWRFPIDGGRPRHELEAHLEGHRVSVQGALLSPKGGRFVSGDASGLAILWRRETAADVPRWVEERRFEVPFAPRDFAFSPDESLLAMSSSSDHRVAICQPGRPEDTQTLQAKTDVHSLALSPDGQLLAVGLANGSILLWGCDHGNAGPTGPRTFRLRGTIEKHGGAVGSLLFHPDGKTLVSGGDDRTVKIWRLMVTPEGEVGILRASLGGFLGGVKALRFSGDGRVLVAAGGEFMARLGEVRVFRAGESP